MGWFGDLLFKHSEKWYKGQLENELIRAKEGAFSSPRLLPRDYARSLNAKNLDRSNPDPPYTLGTFKKLTDKRILSLLRDMKKYGYNYMDLLEKYGRQKLIREI